MKVWFLVLTFREKGKGPKITRAHTHTHSPAGSSSRQLVSLHWATLAIIAHPNSQSYFYWQHVRAYAPPYCQDTLPLSFLLLSLVKTLWSFHTYYIHTQSRTHTLSALHKVIFHPPKSFPVCPSHIYHAASNTVCHINIFLNRSPWPKGLKSQSWSAPEETFI